MSKAAIQSTTAKAMATASPHADWREVKLGEVVDIGSSKRIFYKEYVDEGIPFYRSKEIIEKYNGKKVSTELHISKDRFVEIKNKFGAPRGGDILLTSVGTLGIPYIVKIGEEFYFKDGNLIWFKKFSKNLLNQFLYYWITSSIGNGELQKATIGSTQPALTIRGLNNLMLNLPPLTEQKAIAEVLSSLDDKIGLLHRQNKTLKDIAQALFRKWFVEEANHFKSGKFKLWVEDTIGGEWGKEEVTDDFNVPAYCIRGTDIADLNLGLPKKIPIRYIKQKKLESIKPNDGAIIIEISGGTDNQSTGRTTYINKYVKSLFELPLIFSNFCRMLRVKRKEYTFFVYCYLQYLYDQEEYFNLESGSSGIRNLNYKALLFEIDYPMPNKRNVLNFDKQVKDYFIKINKNKSQIRTLENLRDTLLPKLISRVVRIKL